MRGWIVTLTIACARPVWQLCATKLLDIVSNELLAAVFEPEICDDALIDFAESWSSFRALTLSGSTFHHVKSSSIPFMLTPACQDTAHFAEA